MDPKKFNEYVALAIREGWADPLGFATRRMEEAALSELAKPFHIDPRFSFEPNAAPDCWSCIDDRTYDGAPDASNMIGWGKTKEEALADLVRLFEERADYQMAQAEARCEAEAEEREYWRGHNE